MSENNNQHILGMVSDLIVPRQHIEELCSALIPERRMIQADYVLYMDRFNPEKELEAGVFSQRPRVEISIWTLRLRPFKQK